MVQVIENMCRIVLAHGWSDAMFHYPNYHLSSTCLAVWPDCDPDDCTARMNQETLDIMIRSWFHGRVNKSLSAINRAMHDESQPEVVLDESLPYGQVILRSNGTDDTKTIRLLVDWKSWQDVEEFIK